MDPLIEKQVVALSLEISRLREALDSKLSELQTLMSGDKREKVEIAPSNSIPIYDVSIQSIPISQERGLPSRLFELMALRDSEIDTIASLLPRVGLRDNAANRKMLISLLYRFRQKGQLADLPTGQYQLTSGHAESWEIALSKKSKEVTQ
jgi:hypothetical protein